MKTTKTAGQAEPRKGIAIRIDITADELREFRIYALKHKSSVPKLIAEHIRAMLRRSR